MYQNRRLSSEALQKLDNDWTKFIEDKRLSSQDRGTLISFVLGENGIHCHFPGTELERLATEQLMQAVVNDKYEITENIRQSIVSRKDFLNSDMPQFVWDVENEALLPFLPSDRSGPVSEVAWQAWNLGYSFRELAAEVLRQTRELFEAKEPTDEQKRDYLKLIAKCEPWTPYLARHMRNLAALVCVGVLMIAGAMVASPAIAAGLPFGAMVAGIVAASSLGVAGVSQAIKSGYEYINDGGWFADREKLHFSPNDASRMTKIRSFLAGSDWDRVEVVSGGWNTRKYGKRTLQFAMAQTYFSKDQAKAKTEEKFQWPPSAECRGVVQFR